MWLIRYWYPSDDFVIRKKRLKWKKYDLYIIYFSLPYSCHTQTDFIQFDFILKRNNFTIALFIRIPWNFDGCRTSPLPRLNQIGFTGILILLTKFCYIHRNLYALHFAPLSLIPFMISFCSLPIDGVDSMHLRVKHLTRW